MTGDETPLTLSEYAEAEGRHIQTVRKDASRGRLPTWKDPITGKMVTSKAIIARMRDAAMQAAEEQFLQKQRIGGR